MNPCTPGPWHVDPDSLTATVRNAEGKAVARCYQGDDDARAIALLPDFLDSIQKELKAPFRILGNERPWFLAHGEFCCYADAVPDLLQALHTIDANAGESVEWIRRTARAAITKASFNPTSEP